MTVGYAYWMRVVKSQDSFTECEEKKGLEFNSLSSLKSRMSNVKSIIILINYKKHHYKGKKILMQLS